MLAHAAAIYMSDKSPTRGYGPPAVTLRVDHAPLGESWEAAVGLGKEGFLP